MRRSSGAEDIHPHGGGMFTYGPPPAMFTCGPPPAMDPAVAGGGIFTYRSMAGPLNDCGSAATGHWEVGDLDNEVDEIANYIPKPGEVFKRMTIVQSSGSDLSMWPAQGVTFLFVQGKESACIVTRDLGKGKKFHDLPLDFIGLADVRLTSSCMFGLTLEQPADMCPYAVVSVLLNPYDLKEQKESKPDSSHKDSSSRIVDEQAAVNFLKQKLENNTSMETIQTAISALQCLYQENLKTDEIEVYTAQVGQIAKFLSREEIELHLGVINNETSSAAHLVGF